MKDWLFCQLPNILFFSACDILAIDKSLTPITLVLAEDGTIVDDDDYFLCLPSNTKFVALANNEKWAYNNSDGGTAWISQESFDVDETDSGAGVKWKNVARQLKEDLSSIILLSEEELQSPKLPSVRRRMQ
uniref:DNA fragmentation factor subunit alpha n=1 Tax=Aotus nancymaae TaxID=37293 RepID=A0A2K5EBP6_AOTNA